MPTRAHEPLIAWARHVASGEIRFIAQVPRSQRGLLCGCECPACGTPLQAVNKDNPEAKLKPHFRHQSLGRESRLCEIVSERLAVLKAFQEEGNVDLPGKIWQATVPGLSGATYTGSVYGQAERHPIKQIELKSRAWAQITLGDGRVLLVALTGENLSFVSAGRPWLSSRTAPARGSVFTRPVSHNALGRDGYYPSSAAERSCSGCCHLALARRRETPVLAHCVTAKLGAASNGDFQGAGNL